MGKIIYITGGARSGKSKFAEDYIFKSTKPRIYIATALLFDEEMKERARLHQEQRGKEWITVEAYKDISALLAPYKDKNNIILLDCITNLVSNRMFDYCEDWESITPTQVKSIENTIKKEIILLVEFIKSSSLECVFVSNEVGMGLVPSYPLGRHFRDICGRINQYVAQEAERAYFIVSGLPIELK